MSDERDSYVVQAYLAAGGDSPTCFRMFGRVGQPGCFVLGWWANFVAKEYIKSSTVLKSWSSGDEKVDVVVVNDAICKEIIRDCLLRRGVAVEYYERQSGGTQFTCVQRGSPGNTTDFEATLFEFNDVDVQLNASGSLVLETSTTAADGGVRVGFSTLNTTLRQICFAEYTDTIMLSSLDALLVQTNLKELSLIIPAGLKEEENVVRNLQRLCTRAGVILNIISNKRPMKEADYTKTIETLKKFLRVSEHNIKLNGYSLATQALHNLLLRVDENDSSNWGTFYLNHIIPSTYMKLDCTAIEALNLISKKPEPKGTLPQSIFTWMDRCHTGMGSRAMRQWLLQPLRDVDAINERLSMVELFVDEPIVRDRLVNEVLKRCSDMDRLNRKLQRRSLALKDTQAFLNFVHIVPDAVAVLKSYKGPQIKLLVDEYIAPLDEIATHLGNLKVLIESTVDFSDKSATRMNAEFDDDLQELYVQLAQIQKGIIKEYNSVLSTYEWTDRQLKYEYHNTYGYVFRVSRKEDQQLRTNKELIIVNTAKDGVRFVTEKLSSLSDQYRRVSDEYDKRQQELKKKLVDTIASYLPVLDDAKEVLAKLDVYIAWSMVVKDSPHRMTRPVVVAVAEEGAGKVPLISITNVRHPLVELRQPNYVPNSVHLTSDMTGVIITGPNMGGKSTYMRSVGVAVVLAQAGCFVPADSAHLQIRDAVMCRVGATDHLAQGVSTFMVEMLESAAILSSATPQTFAIIDELGRGTSTYDGFGLAWAIAREIGESIRATMLFSTHFHELTKLPEQCSFLSNMHFGANVDESANTLKFSYKLELGPCGRSFGIYVAALANLPPEVVENAKLKAKELESFETLEETPDDEMIHKMAVLAKRAREVERSLKNNDPDAHELQKRLKLEIEQDPKILSLVK